MKIAWIGTGMMGAPMAGHLVDAGHEVTAWDINTERLPELKETYGFSIAATIDGALENADVVMTMLGYPKDVERVFIGESGLLAQCPAGTLIIDLTSSAPSLAERLAAEGAKKGIDVLDAPVSGGEVGAKNGTLVIMVGGSKTAFMRAEPILKVFAKNIAYMGGAGAGQHTKATNQIVIAAHMAALTEAIMYARKVGLDPTEVFKVIGGGAAGSWQLENAGPLAIAADYKANFFIKHFVKDMNIAASECESRSFQLPILQNVLAMYRELEQSGHGNEGTQALIQYYEAK